MTVIDAVTTARTNVEHPLPAVEAAEAHVRELETFEADARRDLAALEAGEGEDLAAAASRAVQRREELALVAPRISQAKSAESAARRAAVAALLPQAETDLEQARAVVAAHEAKTAKLQQALEDFTGAPYRRVTLGMLVEEERARTGIADGVSLQASVLQPLEQEVGRLTRRRDALAAAAAGQDVRSTVPDLSWVDLPEALRPGGVLPKEGFSPPAPSFDWASEAERLRVLVEEGQRSLDFIEGQLNHEDPARRAGARLTYGDDQLARQRRVLDEHSAQWHTARAHAERLAV